MIAISIRYSSSRNGYHTSCNSKVETRPDGLVYGIVESLGLSTPKGHVGNGALVLGLAGSSILLLSSAVLLVSLGSSPRDAANDIGHGTTAVGAQDLDGDDVGLLGNAVLVRSDGASAVRTMAITILILVVGRNGLAPRRTTLEFNMVDVDTSVNNVDVNTITTLIVVLVLGEGGEGEPGTVANSGKTLLFIWRQIRRVT